MGILSKIIKRCEKKYLEILNQDRDKISSTIQLENKENFDILLQETKRKELSEKTNELVKSVTQQLTAKDVYYKGGDIVNSQAYIIYMSAYNNMYDKWVKEYKIKQSKKKDANQDVEKKITKTDYKDLFNLTQSAYLLILTSFKQVSVRCTIDTMLLLQLIDIKLLDYMLPNLLDIYEKHPRIKVLVEFVPCYDNSIVVRITGVDDGLECFKDIRTLMLNTADKFQHFIQSNHHLTEMFMQEMQSDNEIANTASQIQEENIKTATITYINNYNIILQELERGVFIGINDLRTLFNSMSDIESVSVQKAPQGYFHRQNHKLPEANEQDENGHNKMPAANSVQVGINSNNNFSMHTNIKTTDELLSLIRQKKLQIDVQSKIKWGKTKQSNIINNKYVSKNEQQKLNEAQKLKVKIVSGEITG